MLAQLLLTLFQTEVWVEGKEHVPAGPLVVVSNHRSFLDAPVLIAGLDRPIRFACHYYLAQVPLLREIALALDCIPLKQGSRQQIHFFRQAQASLAAGGVWGSSQKGRSRSPVRPRLGRWGGFSQVLPTWRWRQRWIPCRFCRWRCGRRKNGGE
jgi:hypothetical protein